MPLDRNTVLLDIEHYFRIFNGEMERRFALVPPDRRGAEILNSEIKLDINDCPLIVNAVMLIVRDENPLTSHDFLTALAARNVGPTARENPDVQRLLAGGVRPPKDPTAFAAFSHGIPPMPPVGADGRRVRMPPPPAGAAAAGGAAAGAAAGGAAAGAAAVETCIPGLHNPVTILHAHDGAIIVLVKSNLTNRTYIEAGLKVLLRIRIQQGRPTDARIFDQDTYVPGFY